MKMLPEMSNWRCLLKEAKWFLPCVAAAALAVFLNWNSSIFPLGGPHDSLKFIGMAETIVKGEWLGPYDHMTLIRSPVYSFFIAANAFIGWPLHLFQQTIYLVSILILAFALRGAGLSSWRVVVISILCIFNPLPFYCANFVASEAGYLPAATCVLAGALGLTAACPGSRIHYFFWIVVISISLPLFWYMRPEGIWIVPFLFVCGLQLLKIARGIDPFPWLRVLPAVLIPMACIYGLGYGIRSMNQQYYGIPVIHELEEQELRRAFGWLTRLAPHAQRPYVPISRDAMDQAYKVSPHFALLKPFMSQQVNGQGWTKSGCEWMGICDEIAGGWAVWAIRDAAASVGMYASAPKARNFYAAVAEEVQEACSNGEIQCSKNITGNILAPPIQPVDSLRMLMSLGRIIHLTATFGDFRLKAEDWDIAHQYSHVVERYEKVTNDQNRNFPALYRHISDVHVAFYRVLQATGGLLLLVFGFLVFWGRVRASKRVIPEMKSSQCWLLACLLAFVLGRMGIISYVDAMSYHVIIRYLIAVYPALMVLFIVILPRVDRHEKKESFHGA
jgi:hypothetical protein